MKNKNKMFVALFVFVFLISTILVISLSTKPVQEEFIMQTGFAGDGVRRDSADNVLIPIYGRIECGAVSPVPTCHEDSTGDCWLEYNENWNTFYCGNNENAKECSYYIQAHPSIWSSLPGADARIQFSVNDGTIQCYDENNIANLKGLLRTDEGYKLKTINTGSKIKIKVELGGMCWVPDILTNNIDYNVKESFVQYSIYSYISGAKSVYKAGSCKISDISYQDKLNICEGGSIIKDGNSQNCENTAYTRQDELPFDQWINYVSNWVIGPGEMNIVDYNGQEAFCTLDFSNLGTGKMSVYSIDTITLKSGEYYKFPASIIGTVDCCPGMSSVDGYCDNTFNWHEGSENPCVSDLQCKGQGTYTCTGWNQQTASKYSCQSGFCKLVDTKDINCCPPYYNCPSGKVCKNFKCEDGIGPTIKCGDGICSKPYEDAISCPQDCKSPEDECKLDCESEYSSLNPNRLFCKWGCDIKAFFSKALPYIIGGAIGLVILFILLQFIKPKGGVVKLQKPKYKK